MIPQKGRFAVFSIITSVFILLIVWKFAELMLFGAPPAGNSSLIDTIRERGPILDRNGRILAIQTRLDSVTAWIPSVKNREESSVLLGDILDIDSDEILSKFNTGISNYLYIKRKISPTESRKIKEHFDNDKLAGISLEPEFGRNYPEKNLAAQIIGFTGIDNMGLEGLEWAYNDTLSPEPAQDEEYIYGNQLFLTLDLNIQYFAEKAAGKAYSDYDADSVILLVLEAKTGEILGSVSYPGYNLNTFYDASEKEKQNHAISFSYEPGSVFKVFSISSFLELGGISPESRFYCNGAHIVDLYNGETESIKCLGHHGNISTSEIIKYSCNASAGAASESIDSTNFYQMLTRFGFGRRTNLPLPGESIGLLRKPEEWSLRSKPTLAMGQELNVSAIQIAAAATVFANKGTLLQPHIVKKIVSPEGKIIKESNRTPVTDVLSPNTAETILQMMGTAMESGGTARRAQVDGIKMSSKTGTAQLIDPETGKYSDNMFAASCLSIFPTDNPEIIIYTVIINPKGDQYYGGVIATPVIKEVAEEIVNYRGIKRDSDIVVVHPETIPVKKLVPVNLGEKMPDLYGFSKRELLPLLSYEGIKVEMRGEGWVKNQIPPAGTTVSEGTVIILEFE